MRLGNSGLKVSKIILGCMSYGDPGWQDWVLGEEEGLKHIKYAYVSSYSAAHNPNVNILIGTSYDNGITTFDTSNVSHAFMRRVEDGAQCGFLGIFARQVGNYPWKRYQGVQSTAG